MENETLLFEGYIKGLIQLTYGFEPTVWTEYPEAGKVSIVIDGSEVERSIIMGREGNNFRAVKFLFKEFARRHGFFAYLFISPYRYKKYEVY